MQDESWGLICSRVLLMFSLGGVAMDLGDRFLFYISEKFNLSIDDLYSSACVRAVMILLRRLSSILDRSPR